MKAASGIATGGSRRRTLLSRERILEGAIRVADDGGLGIADDPLARAVARGQSRCPSTTTSQARTRSSTASSISSSARWNYLLHEGDWRIEMHRRCASARAVLRRHPWAIPLLQARTSPGPATLRHLDAVIGCLRGAGFSLELTAHAYAVIDSYVYGFAMSEASLPINGPETVSEVAESMMLQYLAADYPNLLEFTTGHILQPGYDFGLEFDYGLDLVLDALEARVKRRR